MKISVLQHADSEGPGEIANWAAERGHSMEICHLYRGDTLPSANSFDFLVIMGGDMNVYQDRDYPWLKAERQLVRTTMDAGNPALGICLGAQLIADALGGRVMQNPCFEIGWFPVEFASEAREIFPKLPASAMALHWHGDTFDLPAGATRLGVTEGCGEQGYVIPGKCLGLQFHFETDVPLVHQMVVGSSEFLKWPKGVYVQKPETILQAAEIHCPMNRPILFHLLDTFCAGLR